MPNELRIQNGLFLDNFTNNVSAPNFLLIDGNGLVSYFSTGSLTIPTAVASSFPVNASNDPAFIGTETSIWSTGPLSNGTPGAKRTISFGYQAGNGGTGNISIGWQAGGGSGAGDSRIQNIFLGEQAGSGSQTSYSNFIGFKSGVINESNHSTFIGTQVASGSTLGNNNIIIGTNITLPASRANAINIGGIIFGTGSYSTTTGRPFSGSQDPTVGMIGIGTNNPSTTLHVSGTVTITGTSSSFVAPAPPNTQLTNDTAKSFILGLEPKMMGYAASIIPRKSGTIYVSIVGTYALSNDGAYMRLQGRFGTGSVPAFENLTPSGSGIGIVISGSVPRSNVPVPFNVHGLVSGLTLGTTYWIDLQARQTTDTGIIDDVTIVAFEL